MTLNYDNRSTDASQNATICVVDALQCARQNIAVLETQEFLAEIRRRAGSDAEIGRTLGLPSSRVAELFGGKRRLRYDEAKLLSDKFLLEVPAATDALSAETLAPILEACLKYAPAGGWTPDQAPRLARAVEYGLALLTTSPAKQPSEDAIAVAGQAAFLQLRGGHQPT